MSSVYRNILVAVDGSPDADAAVAHPAPLARDQPARPTRLTAIPPPPPPAPPAPGAARGPAPPPHVAAAPPAAARHGAAGLRRGAAAQRVRPPLRARPAPRGRVAARRRERHDAAGGGRAGPRAGAACVLGGVRPDRHGLARPRPPARRAARLRVPEGAAREPGAGPAGPGAARGAGPGAGPGALYVSLVGCALGVRLTAAAGAVSTSGFGGLACAGWVGFAAAGPADEAVASAAAASAAGSRRRKRRLGSGWRKCAFMGPLSGPGVGAAWEPPGRLLWKARLTSNGWQASFTSCATTFVPSARRASSPSSSSRRRWTSRARPSTPSRGSATRLRCRWPSRWRASSRGPWRTCSMPMPSLFRSRWWMPGFCLFLGALIFVAFAVGGSPGDGAVSFAVMALLGAVFLFGRRSETLQGL